VSSKSAFLEKHLEDVLWTNPDACYESGLCCFEPRAFGKYVQRMRQPSLYPYGIADIIQIVHADSCPDVLVQVIECKRDVIGLAAYAQAKRYLAALKCALQDLVDITEIRGGRVQWECILIGKRLEMNSDFVYVLNEDKACKVYTYEEANQAVSFTKSGRRWHKPAEANSTDLAKVAARVQGYIGYVSAQLEADEELFARMEAAKERGLVE